MTTPVFSCPASARTSASPFSFAARGEQQADPITHFVFADLWNLVVGGAQVSASRRGLAATPEAAAREGVRDSDWRLHSSNLKSLAIGTGADRSCRAICIGSNKAGSKGALFKAFEGSGWITHAYTRSAAGAEKEVDTGLTVAMLEEVLFQPLQPAEIEITLLCGDRDLLPVVRSLVRRGFAIDVAAWNHAASSELKSAARSFIRLDDYFDFLSFRRSRN